MQDKEDSNKGNEYVSSNDEDPLKTMVSNSEENTKVLCGEEKDSEKNDKDNQESSLEKKQNKLRKPLDKDYVIDYVIESQDDKQKNVREKLYSLIIAEYIQNLSDGMKLKRVMKRVFFVMILIIFVVVTTSFVITTSHVFTLYEKGLENTALKSAVVQSITSFASLVIALLTLPKIVASYLFNSKEEKSAVKIISNVQVYDTNMERESVKVEQIKMLKERDKQPKTGREPDPKKPGVDESSQRIPELLMESTTPEEDFFRWRNLFLKIKLVLKNTSHLNIKYNKVPSLMIQRWDFFLKIFISEISCKIM